MTTLFACAAAAYAIAQLGGAVAAAIALMLGAGISARELERAEYRSLSWPSEENS